LTTIPSLPFFVLAIETSCDETAVSIVCQHQDRIQILTHVVESQNESHAPFGGVVPEIAARDHLSKIHDIATKAISDSGMKSSDLSAIAVTMGPGLIGALMVGVLYARGLAMSLGKPLYGINHVDAHLAPALMLRSFSLSQDLKKSLVIESPQFPALALTASGGHCHMSLVHGPCHRVLLGRTMDDACGEAFDKVAKLLGMPYPGGPWVESLAAQSSENEQKRYAFPNTLADRSNRYDFSYSGLKTAVVDAIRKETGIKKGKVSGAQLDDHTKRALAYAFEQAALLQLRDRVQNALADFPMVQSVVVAGGVAQNKTFRQFFNSLPVPIHFAPVALCSDNATMIGLHALLQKEHMDGFVQQPFSKYAWDDKTCQTKN